MSLQITTRNVDLTDELKEYVEKKVSKLYKFVDGTLGVHVILRGEKFRQIAEITILANGVTIHRQAQTDDMFTSLDKVVDKVQRQIVKEKGRTIAIKSRKNQGKKEALRAPTPLEELVAGQPAPEIVRGKSYPRKPMAAEEALMQMKMLRDDFFMFINSQTKEVNLLYKRKDGKYWLVEPESE